jgi:hypothetical protein
MIPGNVPSGDPAEDTTGEFHDAFIINAHQILIEGYRRIEDPAAYHESEEDGITEVLVHAMMEHIGFRPESWIKMYQVHEQTPVRTRGRTGKRRPKVDLELVAFSGVGIVRFSWEAKRLGPNHGVSVYLGAEGLGCFLSGQYARDCSFGGMLGYAQTRRDEPWIGIIGDRIPIEPAPREFPSPTSISRHDRPPPSTQIAIYHTILLFVQGDT